LNRSAGLPVTLDVQVVFSTNWTGSAGFPLIRSWKIQRKFTQN